MNSVEEESAISDIACRMEGTAGHAGADRLHRVGSHRRSEAGGHHVQWTYHDSLLLFKLFPEVPKKGCDLPSTQECLRPI